MKNVYNCFGFTVVLHLPKNYNKNKNNIRKACVSYAAQFAGGYKLLKILNYFEVVINIFWSFAWKKYGILTDQCVELFIDWSIVFLYRDNIVKLVPVP